MKTLIVALFAVIVAAASPAWAQKSGPSVVASIKPVHSLLAAVMKGVGTPHLIVQGLSSPHSYSLRPSDARALQQAELVFWVGPRLESFLSAPLEALSQRPKIITLADAPGVAKLRVTDALKGHDHGHDHSHDDHDEKDDARQSAPYDMHIWLDPHNAIAILQAAEIALTELDPDNAALYRANSQATISELQQLTVSLKDKLSSVHGRRFIVFHDAYSYFENRFGLQAIAAIAVNPETPPGAKRLKEIQTKIRSSNVVCVFAEPQFSSKVVDLLTSGTGAKAAYLDPLGALSKAGPQHYPKLLRALAESFSGCLSR